MATEKRMIYAEDILGALPKVEKDRQISLMGAVADFVCMISKIPTVDAVEVVHGRWEWYTDRCEDLFLGCDDDYGWRCSKCKVPLDDEDDPEVMSTFRYCPNCGAKMDGEGSGRDGK